VTEPTLLDILDRLRTRFYGKYRGSVTEVDAATMRIKAKVPAVLGATATGWCTPCVPYAGPGVGWAFLPEVGSGVWIEFEGGDVSLPIWVGCYWRDTEARPPGADAMVKVLATATHTVTLDVDGGKLTIADAYGNEVALAGKGVTVSRGAGTVDVADGKVTVNGGSLEVA
jgi:uncharacterized protein involved in type VI secretion and phage assembly